MSWRRTYRLALHLLPAGLRCKHGPAMETLFARELETACARGWLHGALTGAAGVWDVVRRGAYEQVRPGRAAREHRDINLGGPHMPQPTARQLLRRHAASFAIAFVTLTVSLLAIFATRQLPALSPQGASARTVAEVLLLAVPFTAALTIPMAVFVAVLWEFTRLGMDGTLAAARQARDGIRRLVIPVLGAAAGVGALAFVVTAEIVPRTNQRLTTVLAMRATTPPNARTMTIGELREAARIVRPGTRPIDRASAAVYEVEIQKKLALPAACMVLAFAGVAIALRAPRGGARLVIGASCAVFGAYYVLFVTGESLAARLVIPPFVGMWGPDALVLAAALLAVSTHRARLASSGSGPVVLRG
jgi:lipopolysaccharide export LptBFGC system permease protein LptF